MEECQRVAREAYLHLQNRFSEGFEKQGKALEKSCNAELQKLLRSLRENFQLIYAEFSTEMNGIRQEIDSHRRWSVAEMQRLAKFTVELKKEAEQKYQELAGQMAQMQLLIPQETQTQMVTMNEFFRQKMGHLESQMEFSANSTGNLLQKLQENASRANQEIIFLKRELQTIVQALSKPTQSAQPVQVQSHHLPP